jgi:phytanoyl-CoA hydroxylase
MHSSADAIYPVAEKFEPGDTAGIREHYQSQGFVILRKLLEPSVIHDFLAHYERIKRSRTFIFYSQSIHRAIRPDLNEHGFIRESMLNPSRLGLFPGFSGAIKRCLYHEAVSEALCALDGHDRHVSWQDMFFDLSTGTIDHADTWYLDTEPAGAMFGAWIALENIASQAGTFFVVPRSHRVAPLSRELHRDQEAFRKATLQFVADHGFRRQAMPLDQGDVLFWHPFLVHGAFSNVDPRFSRKSLTSHFFPLGMKRRGSSATPLKPTANPRIFRLRQGNDSLLNLLLYAKFAKDSLRGRGAKMDMRRKSYAN